MVNQKAIKNFVLLFLLGITLSSFGCAHYLSKYFQKEALKLNTPQLIDEYQRQNFSYGTTPDGYGCGGVDISSSTRGCSPSYIYYSNKCNCAAYTTFAVYFLRQAGHEAYPLKVYDKWPSLFVPGVWPRDYHFVALYKDGNKWFVMDNAKKIGIIGPFNTIEDLPYRILNIEGKKKLGYNMAMSLLNDPFLTGQFNGRDYHSDSSI